MWRDARLTAVATLICAACEGETELADRADEATVHERQVVFESVRVSDGESEIDARTRGELTIEAWQRAARPWTYLDEPFLYHEQTWERQREDGTFEQGYRIVRTRNDAPAREGASVGSPELGDGVAERASQDGEVAVILRLRGFPRWNVPLVPPLRFDTRERERAIAEREAALERRRALLGERVAPLRTEIERLGGSLVGESWSGYVLARVPGRALSALAARRDISRIDLLQGEAHDALVDPNPNSQAIAWNMGDARWATRIGADRFFAAGIDGSTPNPSRHSFGRMAAAIVELGTFEDEGCYFSDGDSCTGPSRIQSRTNCSGTSATEPPCRSVATFDDGEEPPAVICCTADADCSSDGSWTCVPNTNLCGTSTGRVCVCSAGPRCSRHGTMISSIIGADYRAHQCDCLSCGDNACAGGCVHGSEFVSRATGMAPEAAMLLWGDMARDPTNTVNHALVQSRALAEALAGVRAARADVVNDSWVWNAPESVCTEVARYPFDLEAEDAYDDGVFVLFAAGNNPATTGCDIQLPAALPKVFAINGMPTQSLGRTNFPDCYGNYGNCRVLPSASSSGGIPATTAVDLVEHPNALTAIALAAPTAVDYSTLEVGDTGLVNDDPFVPARAFGSSSAVAFVTGLAALVKGEHLARGLDWINSPGRLFLVMLSMGDRHFDITTNQLATGGNVDYGFGRVRLRRIEDFSQRATTTYTLGAQQTWAPFAVPLAADTSLVKCVLLQEEDMSEKTTISNVDLRVRIQPPDSAGACWAVDGTEIALGVDQSFDIKSMVAFDSRTTSLAGNCVHVTFDPRQIAGSAVTVHALCYASRWRDDENADACTSGQTRACGNGGTQSCDAASGLFGPCSTDVPNSCTTTQPGVCSAGTYTCSGTALMCSPSTTGSPEICDSVDNDCDGEVDEITASDPSNCGACGNVCSFPHASASCVDSTCAMGACNAGYGDCDERAGCETSLTTIRDCGSCGTLCAPRNATGDCSSGTCVGACDEGWGDCDTIVGCETSLRTIENCGSCGNACALPNAMDACVAGACAIAACDPGFGDCDPGTPGCETNLRTTADCGTCGNVCSAPNAVSACLGGACAIAACDAGFGDCDPGAPGCETSLGSPANCGSCGNACSLPNAVSACVDGACALDACNAGFGDCHASAPGCETSLTTVTDCGACANACSLPHATSACTIGACTVATCDPGFGDCDPNAAGCESSLASEAHCGVCGNACASGSTCVDGACTEPNVDAGVDAGVASEEKNCGCRAVRGTSNAGFVPALLVFFALWRRRRSRE